MFYLNQVLPNLCLQHGLRPKKSLMKLSCCHMVTLSLDLFSINEVGVGSLGKEVILLVILFGFLKAQVIILFTDDVDCQEGTY